MNITEYIFESCQKHSQGYSIHTEDLSLTYGELGHLINVFADIFKDKGIRAGMGIGVMGRNSPEFIVVVMAVLKCGGIVMPISNQLKKAEVETILKKSGLHFLLDDGNGPPLDYQNQKMGEDSEGWNYTFLKAYEEIPFAAHVKDAAIVRYTSGTTGAAKGVIIGHQSILKRVEAANKILQLSEEDTVIWVLQMAYHFVVSIILYLRFGASIALCKDFMAPTILQMANKHEGTLLYASPLHIRLLSNNRTEEMMPTMKRVISTSTAISKQQCEAFEKRFQIPISQAYGIIEVGLPIINHQKAKAVPEAVGYALPDYQVGILNDQFEILPNGEIGHLAMRGPGMFDGYLNPPLLRAEVMEHGWFMTGDLASKDANGLIVIEGRKKSMINVSGNKVFPEEVEAVLNQHPQIAISRVKGFQHRLMGEIVMAEVVLKNLESFDKEDIIRFCRERLITYKTPQKIEFVKELEMTGSGKVKR